MLQKRNLAIMLGLCLLLTACTGFVTVAKEEVNLITNGDFAQGEKGWSIGNRVEGKEYIVDGCFAITKSTSGKTTSIWQELKGLVKDTTYILSFDRYVDVSEDASTTQRLYLELNDINNPDTTYQKGDVYLKPRDTDGWVRTTLAFTTPSGFDPSSASIQIVCNNTSFETDDIFKIDNLKLIESTEWLGFRGNAGTGNAVRKYNNCTAETSRITDLGDKTTGYDSTYDRLCTMYYSANKNRASVTIAIYEMTGATPRLVCIYKMAESTGKQINGAEKSLQSILKNGEKYTAKVFAWDGVSGLSPIVPADTLTFTYTTPTT